MAIHSHQPVGNFDFVFEEAYAKSYEPFLRVLERHPGVRLTLHYSGCLLDWLREHQPKFLTRVATLVKRGQVELLASGYYEPILPLIPESDRLGQITKMRTALRKQFGAEGLGLWLTERVWEPDLPQTLAQAGIHYTILDANQFQMGQQWLPSTHQLHDEGFWDLLGSYTVQHANSSVRLFPASKRLRYWMPFQPVERTIEFLKRLRSDHPRTITFADDGEKFGLWPKTYHWVYEEGWLDQFFTALERERSWLVTSTFEDTFRQTASDGRVALSCGSYEEMLEWSGGYFRNFFTKYDEANAMHQYMLRVSRALQQVESSELNSQLTTRHSQLVKQAREALYAGQCNCAYWHGVFGGLYLSHLRRAVYQHLIAAEQLARRAQKALASLTHIDADGDGQEESILTTSAMSLVIDPAEGGTITQWNLYGARVNLLDTLTRRHEPYHNKLTAKHAAAAVSSGAPPASIHDLLGVKEENLSAYLSYDDHRRVACVDYAFGRQPTLQDAIRSTWAEQRLWSAGPFKRQGVRSSPRGAKALSLKLVRTFAQGTIQKTFRLSTRQPLLECDYHVDGVDIPVLGIEWNISLRDERYLHEPKALDRVTHFELQEQSAGVTLHLSLEPPATLFHFPVETVSESEEGLERTYQGLCLVCFWLLEGSRHWSGRMRWAVSESH